MIATDCDRSSQVSTLYEVINRLTHLRSLAITKPANSRRQPLEVHSISGESQPTIKRSVLRKHFQRQIVSLANVIFDSGKRHPAKRPFSFAEQRTNILRKKARNFESIFTARIKAFLGNVFTKVKVTAPECFRSNIAVTCLA